MVSRFLLALFLSLAAFLAAVPAQAISKDERRVITMTGTGIVEAPADIAHIRTGVVSEAKTARAALDGNSAAMVKIVDKLKTSGVAAKDIQTTSFAVNPRYQHYKDGRPQEIVGYRVTNSVEIAVRDVKRLGEILDQAVTLGANQIGGVTFDIDQPQKLEEEARKRATKDAMGKAALYAEEAGVKLGPILSIGESLLSRPPRPVMARMAMEAKSVDAPIEPGEQAIEARVDVTWEIE